MALNLTFVNRFEDIPITENALYFFEADDIIKYEAGLFGDVVIDRFPGSVHWIKDLSTKKGVEIVITGNSQGSSNRDLNGFLRPFLRENTGIKQTSGHWDYIFLKDFARKNFKHVIGVSFSTSQLKKLHRTCPEMNPIIIDVFEFVQYNGQEHVFLRGKNVLDIDLDGRKL